MQINLLNESIYIEPSYILNAVIIGVITAFILTISGAIWKAISRKKSIHLNAKWITPAPMGLPSDESQMIGAKRRFGTLWRKVDATKKQNIFVTGLPGVGTSFLCKILAGKMQHMYTHIGYFDCNEYEHNHPLKYAMSVCRLMTSHMIDSDLSLNLDQSL